MSSLERARFELPVTLADQLASTVTVSLVGRSATTANGLRRELSFAARRARRSGRIAAPLVGLRLGVYRTTLFGRPYDLVTRSRGRDERVVGIVAAAPEPSSRNRADRLSGEVGSGGSDPRPILSEREAAELALELLGAETEEELDQFLGRMFSSVSKAAQGVTRAVSSVGRSLGKAVDTINKVVPIKSVYNGLSQAAKSIEKGLDAVNKFVPIGSVLSLTPLGMTMRAARSLGRVAAGENIFKVAGNFVKSGLKDVGQAVQLASTVASFVPGVGTGVAAALGAAGALAQGRPITEAVLAAARGALPGGAIAAAAFDVASGLAQGKSLSESALSAARNQLPGGGGRPRCLRRRPGAGTRKEAAGRGDRHGGTDPSPVALQLDRARLRPEGGPWREPSKGRPVQGWKRAPRARASGCGGAGESRLSAAVARGFLPGVREVGSGTGAARARTLARSRQIPKVG